MISQQGADPTPRSSKRFATAQAYRNASGIKIGTILYSVYAGEADEGRIFTEVWEWHVRLIKANPKDHGRRTVYVTRKLEDATWGRLSSRKMGWFTKIDPVYRDSFPVDIHMGDGYATTVEGAIKLRIAKGRQSIARYHRWGKVPGAESYADCIKICEREIELLERRRSTLVNKRRAVRAARGKAEAS